MIAYAFYDTDTRMMQYASALVERGDTVDVLALRMEGQSAFEVLNGVNVYRIQARRVTEKGSFSYLLKILRFLLLSGYILTKRHLSKRYDVIHVHSVPDFLVFAALPIRLMGARVILDIHDILPEFYASKFGVRRNSLVFKALLLTERVSAAFSDHVILPNHLWEERLVSRSVRPGKCTVFINYPDPKMFARRPKKSSNSKFIILYPGSLNKHQGVDLAIRAFAQVAGQMPGAEFHIYGDGPEKPALVSLATEIGLTDQLVIHGMVPTAEIANVMANADLGVVPKRASSEFGNEAASTKIMEFMSLGVPLIVSRTKVDQYYHDSSQVRFFESENVTELAGAMLELWKNSGLRRELVAGATKYVELNSWSQKKFEYLQLVDNLHHRMIPRKTEAPANSVRADNEANSSQAVHSRSQ